MELWFPSSRRRGDSVRNCLKSLLLGAGGPCGPPHILLLVVLLATLPPAPPPNRRSWRDEVHLFQTASAGMHLCHHKSQRLRLVGQGDSRGHKAPRHISVGHEDEGCV